MFGTTESRVSTVKRYVTDGTKALVLVVWTAFWANVVRVHLAVGNPVDAGVTALLLIGPALALVGWRLAARMGGIDVETSPAERILSG